MGGIGDGVDSANAARCDDTRGRSRVKRLVTERAPRGELRYGAPVTRVAPLALVLAATIALSPSSARSNGRFPAAQFVTLGPGARADRIALRTTFGIIVSADGGASWSWLCEELFEYSNGSPWDPPLAWGAANAGTPLFVGVPDGLIRSGDLCSAARVTETMRDFTGDVTTTRDGVVYWVGSNGRGPNRVLASRDGGATFTLAGTIAEGVLPLTIEAAGEGARRVYVTAVGTETSRATLLRSDDGGAHFDELALDLDGGRDAWLAGVDATNPDVVYLRSSLPGDDAGLPAGTLLLRSNDGARSFTPIARTVGPMLGFALSDDGRTLWYGGSDPADRLWRSTDGGMTFSRINDVRVLCLRWHAGALYVCAPYASDGYALGRSRDDGVTVTPLVRFEDLRGPLSCGESTTAGSVCAQRWPAVRQMFAVADASIDASRPDAGAPPSSPPPSCACGVTGRPTDARRIAHLSVFLAFSCLARPRRRVAQKSSKRRALS